MPKDNHLSLQTQPHPHQQQIIHLLFSPVPPENLNIPNPRSPLLHLQQIIHNSPPPKDIQIKYRFSLSMEPFQYFLSGNLTKPYKQPTNPPPRKLDNQLTRI